MIKTIKKDLICMKYNLKQIINMKAFRNISVRIAAAVMAAIGCTAFPVNANAETCGCDHIGCDFDGWDGCMDCWFKDPFCFFQFYHFKGDYDFEFERLMYRIISEDLKTVEIVYHTDDFTCESYEIPAFVTYNDSEYRVVNISSGAYKTLGAFKNCINLKSIYIPSTVKSIDTRAFSFCNNLETIIVDEENEYLSAENGMLFNKEKTELIACPGAKGELIIPDGVTKLADYSFPFCPNVKIVTIPASLTDLGYHSFYHCKNIEDFYFYPTTTLKRNWSLEDVDEYPLEARIHVPRNCIREYIETWSFRVQGNDNHDWHTYYYNFVDLPDTSSVESIESLETVTADSYTVYSLDGKLRLSTKNKSDLENLDSGIYIVNGNKVQIK